MLKKLLMISLMVSQAAWAQEIVSAYRHPDIEYAFYEERASKGDKNFLIRSTPLSSSRYYSSSATLPKATGWKESELQARFKKIRDARFLVQKKQANFPRRSSWLYPDDGCFARAAMANRNVFRWFHPIPNKVFAFGNLRVKTKNSPRGSVSWWYHVAPIVEVRGEKFVLDPAIDPDHPLRLEEWLARMGNPQKIKVSICGSGTYSPGDNCQKETDGVEARAQRAQEKYLTLEWNRLVKLGRSTENELGDLPPWKAQAQ